MPRRSAARCGLVPGANSASQMSVVWFKVAVPSVDDNRSNNKNSNIFFSSLEEYNMFVVKICYKLPDQWFAKKMS